MTARDRATTLLAIAVLEARIAAEKKRLRAEFTTELVTGERVPGLIDPDDPEGTGLGFVQKRKGSTLSLIHI